MPQLYNLEGQPMEFIPDGSPIPSGRWTTPDGGYLTGNGAHAPTQPGSNAGPLPTASFGGGFDGLTPPDGGFDTVNPAPGYVPPTTIPGAGAGFGGIVPPTTGASGGGAAQPAPAQRLTYSQALTQYKAQHPDDVFGSAGFNDRFNAAFPQGYDQDAPGTNPPNPYQTNTGPQNYNQNQTGSQGGQFSTTGSNNTTANQTTGGTQTGATQQNTSGTQTNQGTVNTTGNTATTGNVATTGTGTQSQTGGGTNQFTQNNTGTTTGTSTTGVNDTLGFGGLLQNAAGAATQNDATRNGFLSDVIQTGGTGFNSQVDQAVRSAISGPGLTGAGDSARARAAGYAGAQVARNNMGERLNAAQQLAGPSATTTLVGAGNPYLGQTTTQSGTQTGTQAGSGSSTSFSDLLNSMNQNQTSTGNTNTTGTQASTGSATNMGQTNGTSTGTNTGFSNLVGTGNEATSGTATGNSSQNASGLIPQAQQVSTGGGGGCVLCTVGLELGLRRTPRILRHVIAHKLSRRRFTAASRGYFFLFTPVAVFLLRHPFLARLLLPLAWAVVYEELRVAGRRLPLRVWPWVWHWAGHTVCAVVGRCGVPRHVKSPVVETLARKRNIWFSLP